MSSLVEILTLIINVGIVAIAIGLVFSLFVQPGRAMPNMPFIVLCCVFGLWSLFGIILRLPQQNIDADHDLILRFQVSIMHLIVLAYFVFTTTLVQSTDVVLRLLKWSSGPVVAILVGLTWLNSPFTWDSTLQVATFDSNIAYVIIGAGAAYLGAAFWITISASKKEARLLQIPALLLIAGWLSYIVDPLREYPVINITILITVTMVGWIVLRQNLFNPLETANAELRATNRDLQQVINELAGEKEKTETLNKGLREANQYKSEFLANISHELRTPLNSIIGYSEMLKMGMYGSLNDKQQDRVEKIHRNGAQLLDLISDFLDLNKIDAGKLKLDVASFEMLPLLDQVQSLIGAQCERKNLAMSIETSTDLPRLFGDEKRILQVISNLADNAVKFTPAGAITIKATGAHVKNGHTDAIKLPMIGWLRDGDWLILSVEDTGIGIAPEDQGRIFDEFAQVDGSRTKEFSGTGLGLAIAKRLVEMHSGVIWLKSVPGIGSTFYVALPAEFHSKVNLSKGEIASANSEL